jgi:hypothetical protein
MKLHALVACVAALTSLCACATTDVPEPSVPVVSGFTPLTAAPLPVNFCQGAATSDGLRASFAGFDTGTVARITEQSLNQCNILLAGSFDRRFERLASR